MITYGDITWYDYNHPKSIIVRIEWEYQDGITNIDIKQLESSVSTLSQILKLPALLDHLPHNVVRNSVRQTMLEANFRLRLGLSTAFNISIWEDPIYPNHPLIKGVQYPPAMTLSTFPPGTWCDISFDGISTECPSWALFSLQRWRIVGNPIKKLEINPPKKNWKSAKKQTRSSSTNYQSAMTREIGSQAPQRPLGSLAESTPIRWAVNLAPPRQQTFSGDYNRDMYIYIYMYRLFSSLCWIQMSLFYLFGDYYVYNIYI